jgi:hypothetical protein
LALIVKAIVLFASSMEMIRFGLAWRGDEMATVRTARGGDVGRALGRWSE